MTNKELKNIKGGASIWAIFGAIAAIVFGVGVVDGYVRPLACK